MSKQITKELLSEVLNLSIDRFKIKENKIEYNHDFTGYCEDDINIYELAHKCKEWVLFEHNISLQSVPILEETDCHDSIYWSVNIKKFNDEFELNLEHIIKDTEPEAIFKACRWILENKDN